MYTHICNQHQLAIADDGEVIIESCIGNDGRGNCVIGREANVHCHRKRGTGKDSTGSISCPCSVHDDQRISITDRAGRNTSIQRCQM